jgi:hypothetical protein
VLNIRYNYGLLKGYLISKDAPSDILLAAEALYMAATHGP